MKKKLALLLAAVMTLSAIPFLGLSAGADLKVTSLNDMPEKTLIVNNAAWTDTTGSVGDGHDYEYLAKGFVIEAADLQSTNTNFELELDGGKFMYAVKNGNYTFPIATAADAGFILNGNAIVDGNGEYSKLEYFDKDAAGNKLLFTIEISPNRGGMYVSLTSDGLALNPVKIPLSLYIEKYQDVSVRVVSQSVSTNSLPTSWRKINDTSAAKGGSSAKIDSVKTGRDKVTLDKVILKESVKDIFKNKGWVKLTLTRGYVFTDVNSITANLVFPSGALAIPQTAPGVSNTNNIQLRKGGEELYLLFDWSTVPSFAALAQIEIHNIVVEPDDDTADTDYYGTTVKLTVEGVDYYYTKNTDDKNSGQPKLKLDKFTFDAASFIDYGYKMDFDDSSAKVVEDYAGKKEIKAGIKGDDLAVIKFEEVASGSWSAEKALTFELTDADGNVLDGVKFNSFEVTGFDKADFPSGIKTKVDEKSNSNGVDFTRTKVTLSADSSTSKTEKANVKFKVDFNAAADFTGDVYLTASGRAIGNDKKIMKVATISAPITVKSTKTIVPIGIQTYAVSDVEIIENAAGVLEKGKDLDLSIREFVTRTNSRVTDNIELNPISKSNVTVTDGNLTITGVDDGASYIYITIGKESTTASTIKVSGLAVKILGNAPQGTYSLMVGGNSWVKSFYTNANAPAGVTLTDWEKLKKNEEDYGLFPIRGLVLSDYIEIANKTPNTFIAKNVDILIGTDVAYVDGKEDKLDAATYIDPDAGRTMLPVRAVLKLFNLNENNIIWDPVGRTVTIIVNDRIVVWTIDSSVMKVNNVELPMVDENGIAVKATIYAANDRTYLPLRQLGIAFGVDVLYVPDPSGETKGRAIFNPNEAQYKEASDASAAVTTDESAQEEISSDDTDATDATDSAE